MLLARFWKDRRGGVGPFLALAALPLVGFVGAAVDYSRANATRTALQAALDSTALMLSKEAPTLSAAQIETKAHDYFNALFVRPEATNVAVNAVFTTAAQGNYALKITGSGAVPTVFANLIGQSQISFSATSEVLWGIKKLNLALALDNTGSMSSSGKMTQLKLAAHDFLNTLQKAARQPGDIKVAIVPFAVDVNVGKSNVDASWIDWTDWEEVNGSCSNTNYSNRTSCQSASKIWTPASHSTWNGCVKDRDQQNDVHNTPAGGTAATKFRAHQASACPASLMQLSEDWTGLHNKIDAMTPSGNTNVTIGLALGWQLLSPVVPFQAPAPAQDLEKVLVILTDGQNTQNRWTTSSTSIDARTAAVCTNIKADGIKIYSVRVIDGNASLLRSCATKPDMYYDVEQATELSSVFSSIVQKLANLRLTK